MMFQDAAGTITAVNPGDPVGLVLDLSQGGLPGPELVIPAAWAATAPAGTTATNDPAGTLTGTTNGSAAVYFDQAIPTVPGETYHLAFATGAGNITTLTIGTSAGAGQHFNGGFNANTAGGAVFKATTAQTHIRFGRSAAGSIRVSAISCRARPGRHVAQPVALSRPTLARWPKGGRRNMFTQTAALDHADWVKQQCTVAGTLVTSNAAGSFPQIRQQPVPVQPGQVVTCSVEAWPEPGNANRSLTIIMSAAPSARITCNLDTGAVTTANGAIGGASLLPSGRWRVWWQYTIPAGMTSIQVHYYVGTFAAQPAGVAVNLADPQIEIGAAQTAYQAVVTANDVTEAGKAAIWHLWDDGLGDSLPVVLPAGPVAAASVSPTGNILQESLTSDGVSPINTLRQERQADAILRSEPFTAAEMARIQTYWTRYAA